MSNRPKIYEDARRSAGRFGKWRRRRTTPARPWAPSTNDVDAADAGVPSSRRVAVLAAIPALVTLCAEATGITDLHYAYSLACAFVAVLASLTFIMKRR